MQTRKEVSVKSGTVNGTEHPGTQPEHPRSPNTPETPTDPRGRNSLEHPKIRKEKSQRPKNLTFHQ